MIILPSMSGFMGRKAGFDPDALDYFTRISLAGSSISNENKSIVDTFIRGCKADGNWTKIKAACLMCVTNDLSGALVPLVGPTPTNNGFVADDYSRGFGIKGDGGTVGKYISTNYNHNTEPQNDRHFCGYISSGGTPVINGRFVGGVYDNEMTTLSWSTAGIASRSSNTTVSRPDSNPNIFGFVGVSRSLSTNYTQRSSSTDWDISEASATPLNRIYDIIRISTLASSYASDAIHSFYSIGEAIDLAALDARLTTLMTQLWDVETQIIADDYFARIVAAGSSISESNKAAVTDFIYGCMVDGIWPAIKASCLLCAADDLTGALVPLVGDAPTNYNFVSGDYSRTTGLLGDGSTKYLNSNRNNNQDPQNSFHTAFYATSVDMTGSNNGYIGGGNSHIGASAPTMLGTGNRRSNANIGSNTVGFIGTNRNASADYQIRSNTSNTTRTSSSLPPSSENIFVFWCGTLPSSGYWQPAAARLSFYSIGESIDLALLDARLTTLMAALT